jgi:hypothetical protein
LALERYSCAGRPGTRSRRRQIDDAIIAGTAFFPFEDHASLDSVAGVKLDPRALRWLLGTHLAELRESTVSLEELGQLDLIDLEHESARALTAGGVTAGGVIARHVSGATPTERLRATLREATNISDHLDAGSAIAESIGNGVRLRFT